jgi:hypothetical protein
MPRSARCFEVLMLRKCFADVGLDRIEFPAIGSASLVAGMYQDRFLALSL